MPSLKAFHRLYPSERAKYLFSRRKLLSLSPDNILLIARTPGAHTLDHRIVLPHCLIYRALLLSHCIGTELHRSVVATYNELNRRFLIFQLDSHVKYFIRSCKLCFIAKASKPNPNQVPSLFPTFIKAKQASADSLVFASCYTGDENKFYTNIMQFFQNLFKLKFLH